MAQTKNQHPDGIDNEHTRYFLTHESPEEENSHKNGEKLSKKLPAERRIINRNVPADRNFHTTEKETEKGKENEMRKKMVKEKGQEPKPVSEPEKEKGREKGKERGKGFTEKQTAEKEDSGKARSQKYLQTANPEEPILRKIIQKSAHTDGYNIKQEQDRKQKQQKHRQDEQRERTNKPAREGKQEYDYKRNEERKFRNKQEGRRVREYEPAYGQTNESERGPARNREKKDVSEPIQRFIQDPLYEYNGKQGYQNEQTYGQDHEKRHPEGRRHDNGHDDGNGHGSRHAHGHSHTHQISTLNRAFILGITLNTLFVAAEFIAGFMSDSMGLISDAGHNLSDVASLILAMIAFKLSKVAANSKYTYGYRRSTILVSLLNAIILLIAVGIILAESIDKLFHPQPVEGGVIIWVAGIGVIINAATAWLFLKDKEKDLNVKGAYLHMAADALVSVGVVISGIVILTTGWYIIDPIIGILIALIIVYSTWGLLRDSLVLSLDGVPASIRTEEIEKDILTVPGVTGLHHLHIWALSTTETALTAHIVISTPARMEAVKCRIKQKLADRGIGHATLEIENPDSPCEDR